MRNAKKLLKYTVTLFVATSGLIMGLGSVATASTGTGGASMVGQAGPLVKPILQPLLDRVSAKLDNLTQVSATGTVMFRKPTGADKSQTSCPCVVGTSRVVDETVSLAHESGGAGAIWTIVPKGSDPSEGTATDDHDGSAPLVNSELGLKIQYTGTETSSFVIPPADINAQSGTWVVRAISGDLTATTTINGVSKTAKVPFDPGATEEGSWTCQGNAMTASYAGVGETNTLTRISSWAGRGRREITIGA